MLYADGRIFLSLTPVGLAIKLPAAEFSKLKEKGGKPLRYFAKSPIKKSYLVVPDGLAKNTRALRRLVKISIAYVITLPKPVRKKARKS